jgi:hypothetical protein
MYKNTPKLNNIRSTIDNFLIIGKKNNWMQQIKYYFEERNKYISLIRRKKKK